MSNQLLFSIIIPTFHRNEMLSCCLERLAPENQGFPSDMYEVIVTDDGKQTTAESMIHKRFPWAKWVKGPKRGPAANRNNGALYARGQWLIFTDDDCLPESTWLANLKAITTNSSVQALEGSIKPFGDLDGDLLTCPVNLSGGCFWSANIAIRIDLFSAIGGFDEKYDLAAFEDIDIKLRIENRTKIIFVPDAIVLHPARDISLKKELSPRQLARYYRSWAYHTHKNGRQIHMPNVASVIMYGFKANGRYLIKNIALRRWGNSIFSLTHLCLGLFYVLYFRTILHLSSYYK